MNKRMARNGLALIALALATSVAQAEEGFYAGLGIGSASVELDNGGDPDFPDSLDDSDTSFKVLAGYGFNKYFAMELAYFDGGTAEVTFPFFLGTLSEEVEVSGISASVVGTLP